MNKKMLAAIAVVIIVIVAGVAVYYLLKEGDGDKAPALKESFEVGDYYTVKETFSSMGETEVTESTLTIVGISGDLYNVTETSDGVTYNMGLMTRAEFLSDILPPKEELTGLSSHGTEALQTAFGKISCERWEGTYMGTSAKLWISPDNGVLYHGEASASIMGITATSTMDLTAGTIFAESQGGGESGAKYLRTTPVVGDYYSIDITSSYGDATESYEETRTVKTVGGEYVGVEVTGLNYFPTYETMTIEEFVTSLSPNQEMYEKATKVGSETVSSKMGEFDCDILQYVNGEHTTKIWVAKDPTILVKVEMDITMEGQTMKTVGFVDTNMLQDTESVPEQGSGQFVANTDPAVGDFVVMYGWIETGGERVEQTVIRTVTEVSGGLVTYIEERDDGSMTTFNDTTVDVFLDMSYIPDETLSQMTQVGQEYRDTVRGQALCDHVRMSGNGITFDAWLYHGTSSVAYLEIELVENGTTQRSSVAFDTSLLDEI